MAIGFTLVLCEGVIFCLCSDSRFPTRPKTDFDFMENTKETRTTKDNRENKDEHLTEDKQKMKLA